MRVPAARARAQATPDGDVASLTARAGSQPGGTARRAAPGPAGRGQVLLPASAPRRQSTTPMPVSRRRARAQLCRVPRPPVALRRHPMQGRAGHVRGISHCISPATGASMSSPPRSWTCAPLLSSRAARHGVPAGRPRRRGAQAGVLPQQHGAVVFKLLNDIRRDHKLPPFRFSVALRSAAREHSADMLARHYFEHNSPGETFDHRIRRHLDSSLVGENIAWGTGRYATPQGIVKLWMNSPDAPAHHPHARPAPDRARRRRRQVRRQPGRRNGDGRLRGLAQTARARRTMNSAARRPSARAPRRASARCRSRSRGRSRRGGRSRRLPCNPSRTRARCELRPSTA